MLAQGVRVFVATQLWVVGHFKVAHYPTVIKKGNAS